MAGHRQAGHPVRHEGGSTQDVVAHAVGCTAGQKGFEIPAGDQVGGSQVAVRPGLGAAGLLQCYTDASWAAAGDRKSTSAASLWFEGVALAALSRTQATISLSSCEAELYACNSGAQEAKFAASILSELSVPAIIRIYTDASSTLALSHRRGLGKPKHVETRFLWLQDEVAHKRLQMARISTLLNPADVGTKHLSPIKLRALKGLREA